MSSYIYILEYMYTFRLSGILLILAPVVAAQSVIVGIPSADVTKKGHIALAHESQFGSTTATPRYWNSFTFGTYGVGKNTELAASLYGFSSPSSSNRAIGFGFKTSLPLGESLGPLAEPRFTFGQMTPVSFDGKGVGFWGYSSFSARLPGTRTRITAGPSWGTRQIFGRNVWSAMVGVEQPLTKKLTFLSDWMSGTHDLAAGVAAIGWQINQKFILISGYKFSNNARSGPNAVIVELAWEIH